jgi:hypothetical protein
VKPIQNSGGKPQVQQTGWHECASWRPRASPRPARASLAEVGEAALAAWTGAALVGIGLGLGLAKYAQAWAQDSFHVGAVWGSACIAVSLALGLLAVGRYLAASARLDSARPTVVLLSVLSGLLLVSLAWAAGSVIWLAGWQLPPVGPERP